MTKRKGLGRGLGKGYKNLIPKDPKVHSDSAKGRKQPQKVVIPPKLKSTQKHNNIIKEFAKLFYDELAHVRETKYFNNMTTEQREKLIEMEKDLRKINTKEALNLFLKKHKSFLVESGLAVLLTIPFFVFPTHLISFILAEAGVFSIGALEARIINELKKQRDMFKTNYKKIETLFPFLPEERQRRLATKLTIKEQLDGG